MRRLLVLTAALAALATPVLATDDAIATRKAIMQSNGASAGLAGGMLKQEIPYSPAAGKAVLAAFDATALTFGDYFPEGSSEGDTRASPKIWEDMAGFTAELEKFRSSALAGYQAGGKDGPADLAAFQAAVGPVFDSCKTCHESYQLPRE